MQHRDAWMADVLIVLDPSCAERHLDDTLAAIKAAGVEIEDVNREEGVVEGVVDASRVSDIQHMPGVNYVRTEYRYVADYPTGDPRDQGQA